MSAPAEERADGVDLEVEDEAAFDEVVAAWLDWLLDQPSTGTQS